MSVLRRAVQIGVLIATIVVGLVALALVASQTVWFQGWLRGYIERQANQALDAEVGIGSVRGNLFYGVEVLDIVITFEGERVIVVPRAELEYSFLDFLGEGIVIDRIRLERPAVLLRETPDGWNLARLAAAEEREEEREGPARPITLDDIQIVDGDLRVIGDLGGETVRLPGRFRDLNVRAAFFYEPVHYTVEIGGISFRGESPAFALERLSGVVAVRDRDVHVSDLLVRTGESHLALDGVVHDYAGEPAFDLAARSDGFSLPEMARLLPTLENVDLRPAFEVTTSGPAKALAVDLDLRSDAGAVNGSLKLDVTAPTRSVAGEVELARVDLAPVLGDPAHRSVITGRARIDLRFPGDDPLDRMAGSWRFAGPRAAYGGYEAADVQAEGRIDGPRLTLDARAAAYRGRATARGAIVLPDERRPLAFDLSGRAAGVDLRRLPPDLQVPAVESRLNLQYGIRGRGEAYSGRVRLAESMFAGAVLAAGTTARFAIEAGRLEYGASGRVSDLDLQRIGQAFDIGTLAAPEYASALSGTFDVSGEGTELSSMRLEATGELVDSELMGGRLPRMAYDARLEQGVLRARTEGEFAGFDPAVVAGRPDLAGTVGGEIDGELTIANLGGEPGLEDVAFEGRLAIAASNVGEFLVDQAVFDGRYVDRVARITELSLTGPDGELTASGTLALEETGESDLQYRVAGLSLPTVGALLDQPLRGMATVEGRVTGNARELRTTGSLDGSNVGYGEHEALDLDSRYDVLLPDLDAAQARVHAETEAVFVQVAGLKLVSLRATTTYAGERLEFDADLQEEARGLEVAGELILHPDHQEIHLPVLVATTEGITWRIAPDVDARIEYGADRLRVHDVRLVSGAQEIAADGDLALTAGAAPPERPLEVRARQVSLAEVDRLLLLDRDIDGRLDATATINGSLEAPVVEAKAEIRQGRFQDYGYDRLAATVRYDPAWIDLDAVLEQRPGEWMTARGRVPRAILAPAPDEPPGHVEPTDEDRIDLRVQTSLIDLGFIQGFTDLVTDVRGTLQADIQVSGAALDPHFEGFVDIRGGAFAVPLAGTSYTGVETRITLEPDRVVIRQFQLLDRERNPLTVTGELAAHERQIGDVDISFRARAFEVIDNELGDVDVNADLRLTGDLRRPRVVGDVSAYSGRVQVDRVLQLVAQPFAPAPEAPAARPALAPGPEAPPIEPPAEIDTPGVFDQLALDVRLRIPNNLVLRGADLRVADAPIGLGDINITVGGDLRVVKEPGEDVRLLGTVTTVRGTYTFQGRRFELERGGTIRFLGLEEVDAELNIVALRVIQGVEARVHILGTVSEPQLELSSNPPQAQADILSLIVFNRPINQLGEGQRTSLAAQAGALATGFVAAPLADSIGRVLNVDLFEIQAPAAEDGGLLPRVTLGHHVGDRLFVRFSQQFGAQEVSEFILEYQIADFLRLQTAISEGSGVGAGQRTLTRRVERAGIDLIFFFSY